MDFLSAKLCVCIKVGYLVGGVFEDPGVLERSPWCLVPKGDRHCPYVKWLQTEVKGRENPIPKHKKN